MSRYICKGFDVLRLTGAFFALAMIVFIGALVGSPQAEGVSTVTSLRDLMSESAPSSASNHKISFTLPTAVPLGGKVVLTFHSDFDTSAIGFDDVDMDIDGNQAAVSGAPGVNQWQFSNSSDVFTFDGGASVSIGAGQTVTIYVGKNTYVGAVGNNQITNPATSNASYSLMVQTKTEGDVLIDDGSTHLAIVPTVELTAEIRSTFSFIVDGMDAGSLIDSQAVASASTASRANFGVLTVGTPVMMGTSLSLRSNAEAVTVSIEQNHDMIASTGADIDSFADGADTYPAATYAAPTGTLGSENTYGHLAITTEDSSTITKTASVTSTTDGQWIGLDVSAGPRTIWSVAGPADGTTQDIGHIDVGYRVEIAAAQEAGRYENRLMYIATPVFGTPATCTGSFAYCNQVPSMTCRNGVVASLPSSGMTSVRNSDAILNVSSAAPVTGYAMDDAGPMVSGYDQNVALDYSCSNLGVNLFDAYVYNKNGGDYCSTYVVVQNNISTCDSTPALSGYPAIWGTYGMSVNIGISDTATLSYDDVAIRSLGLIDNWKTRIGGAGDVAGKIATFTCSHVGVTQTVRFYACNGALCNYVVIPVDVYDNGGYCP